MSSANNVMDISDLTVFDGLFNIKTGCPFGSIEWVIIQEFPWIACGK